MNWIKPDWPAPPNVHAAITLRTGGISTGGFSSLNPAEHVNDDPRHVLANRQIIKEMLKLPGDPLWLQQVHGIEVVKAGEIIPPVKADASFTDQPDIVCAVLTADCLPVLFCGDEGRVVAAAHAGWRGLQAGIIAETHKAMNCQKVQVWLGPAIGPEQFEVGEEVRTAFVDADPATADAFRSTYAGKWLADIYHLARIKLAEIGVEQIYGGGFCTVTDSRRFYSYRRDGGASGRMASLIWREKP